VEKMELKLTRLIAKGVSRDDKEYLATFAEIEKLVDELVEAL